ncbi:MAG: hypothetical protein KME60_16510 [Cyanomargarita calcarea GSE-NOS-MK-12-04C]|jgi:uncharacterized coiled-coil DUF342 family protein|uniref:Uncharacterized protein n=1 Tax=Cyanomargarita calcarea GSE-NOS-MK-12-04C TaxID=2839659 RepID=A0A951QN44_9CYAN|nr:hypothetical protein [Cyanomargarita calcarea GSE-NOS-MK-12-04C]
MEQVQAEIAAIRTQIDALRQERATLTINSAVTSADSSPKAIAQAYRRHAQETAQVSTEIQGIDNAIAALEFELQKKQVLLRRSDNKLMRLSIEEEVESGKIQARVHAERINLLAAELATELKALKTCANQISPSYWQVYYKPFITGFKTISVPYVRSDGDVWTIVNRIV